MKIKNNSGITLIALIVTVVVLAILMISITKGIEGTLKLRHYFKPKEDIIALGKAVQNYYIENDGQLPIANNAQADTSFLNTIRHYKDRNPNDNDVYYPIDVNLLEGISLNYPDNVYLVNEWTLTVYSQKSYTLNGQQYFTASAEAETGKFASEYYQKNGEIPIISYAVFESKGPYKNRATYGDRLMIKMISPMYPFTDYQMPPSADSFEITIQDDNQQTIATINQAYQREYKNNDKTCILTYVLPSSFDTQAEFQNAKITAELVGNIVYNENKVADATKWNLQEINFYQSPSDLQRLVEHIQSSMENGEVNYDLLFRPTGNNWKYDRDKKIITIDSHRYLIYLDGTYVKVDTLEEIIEVSKVEGYVDFNVFQSILYDSWNFNSSTRVLSKDGEKYRIYPDGTYYEAYHLVITVRDKVTQETLDDTTIEITTLDETIAYSDDLYFSSIDQLTMQVITEGYENYSESFTIQENTDKVVDLIRYITVLVDTNTENAEVQLIVNGVDQGRSLGSKTAYVYNGDTVQYYIRAPYCKTISGTYNNITSNISEIYDLQYLSGDTTDTRYIYCAYSSYSGTLYSTSYTYIVMTGSATTWNRVTRVAIEGRLVPRYSNRTTYLNLSLYYANQYHDLYIGSNSGSAANFSSIKDVNIPVLSSVRLGIKPYNNTSNQYKYYHSTTDTTHGPLVTITYNQNNRVDPNDAFLQTHSFLVDE